MWTSLGDGAWSAVAAFLGDGDLNSVALRVTPPVEVILRAVDQAWDGSGEALTFIV